MAFNKATASPIAFRREGRSNAVGRRRMLTQWIALLILPLFSLAGDAPETAPAKHSHGYSYRRDVMPEVPWSIHIFELDRSRREFQFRSTLGNGDTFGLTTIPEQLQRMPTAMGKPLAAINGDYYDTDKDYQGRPRDVQIHEGEVVTPPAGHTSFWIDPQGQPHMTNVFSRFRAIWPDGSTSAIGLNAERKEDAAVLYTAVVGASTRTSGGVELILEGMTNSPWLPLRIGQEYQARVRTVRNSGNTPLSRDIGILSVGPDLVSRMPRLQAGAVVRLVTETVPDLTGVRTAIGGGPALVQNGKVMEWSGMIHVRHPRTALGWNKDSIFLVTVDGRQRDLSVGMTFSELSEYMRKLGCDQAMNLDGGGSTTLWLSGNVMNNPSEGRERPGANALEVVQEKLTEK